MASIPKEITDALSQNGLCVLGGFTPTDADEILATECRSLLMVGPDEPRFWSIFSRSAEFSDCDPNPMDRWSHRVLTQIANDHDCVAHFPFGGPPFAPFYQWALNTGRVFASPIRLLVHDTSGLFVSFRGALAVPYDIDFDTTQSPCQSCPAPCLNACPVNAFAEGAYNAASCSAELRNLDREDCVATGCAARRACPISKDFGRVTAQSKFHMRNFIGLD